MAMKVGFLSRAAFLLLAAVVSTETSLAEPLALPESSPRQVRHAQAPEVIPGEYIVSVQPAQVQQLVSQTNTSSASSRSSSAASFVQEQAAGHALVQNALGAALAGQVTVRAQSATSAPSIRDFSAAPDLFLLKNVSSDQVKALQQQAGIQRVTPNLKVSLLATPSDLQPGQWGLNHPTSFTYTDFDGSRRSSTPDFDIQAPEAWDVTTGSPDVVVAIVDTGVDTGHPDLTGNLFTNAGETPGNRIDDDGNGLVDDYAGYNFAAGSTDTSDTVGHGTFIAGVIAAQQNGSGIVGTTWRTRYLPLKVADADGDLSLSAIIDALRYIAALRQRGVNVRVANLSFGGAGDPGEDFQNAMQRLSDRGVLVSIAAGNDSLDTDGEIVFPNMYRLPGSITVASADPNGTLSSFSNYGRESVDIAAPGGVILSTKPRSLVPAGYAYDDGTSFAAPCLAGVAALMFARSPSLTSVEAVERLKATATRRSFTRPLIVNGMLNARAAVDAASQRFVTVAVSFQGAPLAGVSVTMGQSVPAPSVSTGANGEAQVSLAQGASTRLAFAKPGFTFSPASVNVTANSDQRLEVVASPNQVTLRGSVRLSNNSPMVGALVRLDGTAYGRNVVKTANTDAQGNYSISGDSVVFGLNYTLTAYQPGDGYTLNGPFAGTANGDVTTNFVATPISRVVSGTIAIGGAPISGVAVAATSSGLPSQSATTNAQGRFSFTYPHGTTVSLAFTKAGYTFPGNPRQVNVVGPVELTINPQANPVTFSGQVKTPANAPVAGATVTLTGTAYGQPVTLTATTNAQGRYSISGATAVVGMTYRVAASMPSAAFTFSAAGTGTAAGNVTKDFTATPTVLSGFVRFNGAPLPQVRVDIQGLAAPVFVTTAANGAYTVSGRIPPGVTVTITPTRTGYRINPLTRTMTMPANGTLTNVNFVATR